MAVVKGPDVRATREPTTADQWREAVRREERRVEYLAECDLANRDSSFIQTISGWSTVPYSPWPAPVD